VSPGKHKIVTFFFSGAEAFTGQSNPGILSEIAGELVLGCPFRISLHRDPFFDNMRASFLRAPDNAFRLAGLRTAIQKSPRSWLSRGIV
jgi:hypothetical protein